MEHSIAGGRALKPGKSAFVLQSLGLLLLVAISHPVQSQTEHKPEISLAGGASFPVYKLPALSTGYALGAGVSLPLGQSSSLVLNFGYDRLRGEPVLARYGARIIRTYSLHIKFAIARFGENIPAYISVGAGAVRTSGLDFYSGTGTLPALFFGTGLEIRTNTIFTPFVDGTLSVYARMTGGMFRGLQTHAFIPVKAGVRIRL
jgi:hypothetical protein